MKDVVTVSTVRLELGRTDGGCYGSCRELAVQDLQKRCGEQKKEQYA